MAVQALQTLYTSLNTSSQLTNWKSSGGDPCAESWKGVTCQGSAVVSMYVCLAKLSPGMFDCFKYEIQLIGLLFCVEQ